MSTIRSNGITDPDRYVVGHCADERARWPVALGFAIAMSVASVALSGSRAGLISVLVESLIFARNCFPRHNTFFQGKSPIAHLASGCGLPSPAMPQGSRFQFLYTPERRVV